MKKSTLLVFVALVAAAPAIAAPNPNAQPVRTVIIDRLPPEPPKPQPPVFRTFGELIRWLRFAAR